MSYSSVSGVSYRGFQAYDGQQVGGAYRYRGRDHETGTEGAGQVQGSGGGLFTALLQALTQAAGIPQGSATGTTPATAGTSSTSGGSATTPTDSTPQTSLAQDLQAFLHDLFRALRQAAQPSSASPAAAPTVSAATTSATPATTAASTTPAATSPTAGSAAAQYAQQGLTAALQSLLADFSNSQILSTGTSASSSGASNTTLSALTAAFAKLVGDLQPAGSTTDTQTATAALQSFLTNLLQDLQGGGTTPSSTLGSTVNTTA
jgi:hypothetical protein